MPDITVNIAPVEIESTISTTDVNVSVQTNDVNVNIGEQGPQGPQGPAGQGTGILPSAQATLSGVPSELAVSFPTESNIRIDVTIQVNSPYTFVSTGTAGGAQETIRVTNVGGDLVSITRTNTSSQTFSIPLSLADFNEAGFITITGTVTMTHEGTSFQAPLNTRIRVTPRWYRYFQTSVPTQVFAQGAGAGEGPFHPPETFTVTNVLLRDGGNRSTYVALPTRSNGYFAKSGEYFLALDPVPSQAQAFTDANLTLYAIPDADDGVAGTLTISLTEA